MNKLSIESIKGLFYKKGITNNTEKTRDIGAMAEEIACDYLQKQKLVLMEKNYLCKHGEIDLIMRDHNTLVFVEVRYRKNMSYGSPLESVTQHKLRRIQTAINHYTMKNNLGYIPCRIDVVGLHGRLTQHNINWVKNIITE